VAAEFYDGWVTSDLRGARELRPHPRERRVVIRASGNENCKARNERDYLRANLARVILKILPAIFIVVRREGATRGSMRESPLAPLFSETYFCPMNLILGTRRGSRDLAVTSSLSTLRKRQLFVAVVDVSVP